MHLHIKLLLDYTFLYTGLMFIKRSISVPFIESLNIRSSRILIYRVLRFKVLCYTLMSIVNEKDRDHVQTISPLNANRDLILLRVRYNQECQRLPWMTLVIKKLDGHLPISVVELCSIPVVISQHVSVFVVLAKQIKVFCLMLRVDISVLRNCRFHYVVSGRTK